MKKFFVISITLLFAASVTVFGQTQKPAEKKEAPKTEVKKEVKAAEPVKAVEKTAVKSHKKSAKVAKEAAPVKK